jgi:heme/copper-type cytochrome/quinol oxidase subunit 2
MRRSVAWSVALGLALASLVGRASAQDKKIQEVGKDGLKVEGTIDEKDKKVELKVPGLDKTIELPAKLYQLKLKGGTAYRLEMSSDDLDSFLIVQDAAGKQLAFDDDSGGGTNGLDARLDFTPPKDGTYKVFAASLKGTGKYTLRVRPTGAAKGGEKEGKEKAHEVGKGGLKLTGKLDRTEPKVRVVVGEKMGMLPAKLYRVNLKGGTKYRIKMSSDDFDAFLVVQDAAGKQLAFDDDSGGGTNGLDAQVDFTPPKDGTYKIFAASLVGKGEYTLTVQPMAGDGGGGGADGAPGESRERRPAVSPPRQPVLRR